MSFTATVIIGVLVAALAIGALVLALSKGGSESYQQKKAVNTNLRALVQAQRASMKPGESHNKTPKANLALEAAAQGELNKKKTVGNAKLTLEKRLRYARWPITPLQFRAMQVFISLLFIVPTYLHATIFLVLTASVLSPLLVGALLNRSINNRFELFDADYPVLLLSYVSLLKTGMNAIQGLEAAAKGLDENSVVRAEVELLIERLRLGLTEEQAIGAFGEDVNHPELELFVQSLILSRRVGGTLSHTLERLAKQVRKRQQFRKQAIAVVGMERSSLYAIAVIMTLLLGYLCIASPELILPALKHDLGMSIVQFGIMLVAFGFFWSNQVTKLKI